MLNKQAIDRLATANRLDPLDWRDDRKESGMFWAETRGGTQDIAQFIEDLETKGCFINSDSQLDKGSGQRELQIWFSSRMSNTLAS